MRGGNAATGEFLKQYSSNERLMNERADVATHTRIRSADQVGRVLGWDHEGGIERMEGLNDGPCPLVKDQVVAQAWGSPALRITVGLIVSG